MRRTDEEFRAEVLRRSEAYKAGRKERRKKTVMICLPVLVCGGLVWGLMSFGMRSMGATESAADNAAAQNAACAEAPAAMEEAEEEAKEYSFDATAAAMEEPMEAGAVYSAGSAAGEPVPEDFNIRFTWSIGGENIYDTYEGLIQKDLVLDGTACAEFEPDREVLAEVYDKLLELDIASISREMTSEVLTRTGEAAAMEPLTVYEIRFTMHGQSYTVTGDDTASCYPEDEDAAHFMEFVNFMCGIVRETPEYQAFPEANGGYD